MVHDETTMVACSRHDDISHHFHYTKQMIVIEATTVASILWKTLLFTTSHQPSVPFCESIASITQKTWWFTTSQQLSLHFYRKHDCSRANSNRFCSADNMIFHDEPTVIFFHSEENMSVHEGPTNIVSILLKTWWLRQVNSCHLFTRWRAKSLLPFYGKHNCSRQVNNHRLNSAENITVHDEPSVIASIL